jgi:hypothetical protein
MNENKPFAIALEPSSRAFECTTCHKIYYYKKSVDKHVLKKHGKDGTWRIIEIVKVAIL